METKEHLEYDILVIGCGPAGIAAALACIRHGKKTLLIGIQDTSNKIKSDFGIIESIHPGVMSILNSLNINDDFSEAILGSYNFISDGAASKSLNPYNEEIWTGFHISKKLFTKHLIQEAKKQGLQILEDEKVEALITNKKRVIGVKTKSGNNILANYTIDASGNSRVIGKKLRFYEKYYSPSLIVLTGTSSSPVANIGNPKNAYFLPTKNGWTWLAQLKNNSYYWTRLLTKGGDKISAPHDIFKSNKIEKVANMRWRIFRPTCTEGGVLCGEAACLIDPAAGQGILTALTSGIRAGQTAAACIDNPQMENIILAGYDDWIITQFEQKANQLKENYEILGIDILSDKKVRKK